MSKISERLLLIMERKHLSREQLCEKANIGPTTLERYLSGYCEPDPATLAKLAFLLAVPEAYLTGASDAQGLSEPITKLPVFGEFPGQVKSKEDLSRLRAVDYFTGQFARGNVECCYFVIIKDDSMLGCGLKAGDKALIDPNGKVVSGDLAVVSVAGKEPAIRRIFMDGSLVRIVEESSFGNSEVYDAGKTDIKILGSVVFAINYPR